MPKDDDDLLPVKKKPAVPTKTKSKSSASTGPSTPMLRLMRITRGVGIFLGGFVTLVAVMSVVGLVTDNFIARLVIGLLVVIGLPAFVADRMLKRSKTGGGGIVMVVDVFAMVLLAFAIFVAGIDVVSEPLLRKEGDRYAKSGSFFMARVVYYLAGRSPIFPHEKPQASKPSSSTSASGGK